jgi:hypothetical protein
MKTNQPTINWIVDAVLFVGSLVCCWLDLTSVSLHEWLGLAVGALAGYHLFAHSSWAKAVTARFFTRTSRQARTYYLIDTSLLLGFLLILITGLVISTWLAVPLGNYLAWKNLHVIVSIVTLLIVLKITLHWRWIITTVNRYTIGTLASAEHARSLQPVPVPTTINRRDFLKLMGLVGIATVIPLANGFDSLVQGLSQNITGNTARLSSPAPSQPSPTKSTARAQSQTQTTTTSGACSIRCPKNCSSPGRCRKYVDSNNNNRCDLSECV